MYNQIISRVEGTLKTLGLEPADAKTGEGQYNLTKDQNIEVMIDVWEQNGKVFFQAMSALVEIESDDFLSYKKYLEENHNLVEAAFTLINNKIFIKETIECSAFFSQERAISSITRIAFYNEVYKVK